MHPPLSPTHQGSAAIWQPASWAILAAGNSEYSQPAQWVILVVRIASPKNAVKFLFSMRGVLLENWPKFCLLLQRGESKRCLRNDKWLLLASPLPVVTIHRRDAQVKLPPVTAMRPPLPLPGESTRESVCSKSVLNPFIHYGLKQHVWKNVRKNLVSLFFKITSVSLP